MQCTLQLRFVALPLLVEDVDLDRQVGVGGRLVFQLVERREEFEADELVADAQAILELRSRDDDAVDESHQSRLVLDRRGVAQLAHHNGETVTIACEIRPIRYRRKGQKKKK